jgi:hypothetical protein
LLYLAAVFAAVIRLPAPQRFVSPVENHHTSLEDASIDHSRRLANDPVVMTVETQNFFIADINPDG